MADGRVTLFLCGDVMTGRGVDQILPHPGDPRLAEPWSSDARSYVRLAETASGPIPHPVAPRWVWGDALDVLDREAPSARLINLETAVTAGGDFAPGKGIHYRMHPANTDCLTVARPDVCVLANNHVLDFGRAGLADTLEALARAGLRTAGAGRDEEEARRPAIIPGADGGRIAVFACAAASSGVPPGWAAGPARGGVDFLPGLSPATAAALTRRVRALRRDGDTVVVSLHWGPNWGYRVGPDERRFAHALADGGADVVYGHSSHHPRPVEVYHGKLILYGCGDFIDDYEGISGYEEYRDDLRLAYFATLERPAGFASLRMVPLRARQMRLHHAPVEDAAWLRDVLDRVSRPFGSRVDLAPDGALLLRSPGQARLPDLGRPPGSRRCRAGNAGGVERVVPPAALPHPAAGTGGKDRENGNQHGDMDSAAVAEEYASHLSDADIGLLVRATQGRAGGGQEVDAARVRRDPVALQALLADRGVAEAVLGSGGDPSTQAAVSPFLVFAVVVHRAVADLASMGHVPERTGLRQRVPLFDAPDLRDFLSSPARRLFLAELLASFTRVTSGRYRVQAHGQQRTRRFSELDPVRLAGLLDAVPGAERPGVYRRLGDVSLFLTGVFPDYASGYALGPVNVARLLRAGRVPAAQFERLATTPALELLEYLGARWYRTSWELAPVRTPRLKVVTEVADRFRQARRVLNHVADRNLFPEGRAWLSPPPGPAS